MKTSLCWSDAVSVQEGLKMSVVDFLDGFYVVVAVHQYSSEKGVHHFAEVLHTEHISMTLHTENGITHVKWEDLSPELPSVTIVDGLVCDAASRVNGLLELVDFGDDRDWDVYDLVY